MTDEIQLSANRPPEEQDMALLEPIYLGPGAYGSPDPATSENVMLPAVDDPHHTQTPEMGARGAGAGGGVPDFSSMNKDELLAAAEAAEIEDAGDMKVDDLRDAVEADYIDSTSKKEFQDAAKALGISASGKKEDLYLAILAAQAEKAEAGEGEEAEAGGEQRTNVETVVSGVPAAMPDAAEIEASKRK